MNTLVKRQLEARADAGRRIDRELRARDARPLLDDGRADAAFLQLARGQPTLERETLAVVLDDEAAGVIAVSQTHEHVARPAVLPDIDERLLDDPRQFERRRRRERNGTAGPYESRRHTRIAAEALDQRGEHVGKLIARFELDWPQCLHQLPQCENLALQQLLN